MVVSINQPSNERPTWDAYFMQIAFDVSARSDDQFIKHGAVIVDNKTKHIIGTGYNNTIRGADLSKIPIHDRDARRLYMQHSEVNALLNCTKQPLSLSDGATLYITGLPCLTCLQYSINSGITRIVYAKRMGSITEDEESAKIMANLLSMVDVEMEEMEIEQCKP